jgi:hypothetical protein
MWKVNSLRRGLRDGESRSPQVCSGDVTALWGTMTNFNVSHRNSPVSTNRTAGLYSLLRYSQSHSHSRLWIGAIQMILARRGGAHV